MRKLIFVVGCLSALLVSGHAFSDDALVLRAGLTGGQEVPPVETETHGVATFEVLSDRIHFLLDIERADDILAVAGVHIHCAPAGKNGPVVAFLAGSVPGGYDGGVRIKATIASQNLINAACGATLQELVESMIEGNTYVNVHSARNPAGEIRGQIQMQRGDDQDD